MPPYGQTEEAVPGTIALNKKALHDYFIEQKFEAGLVLAGWEVKSLRAGKAQLVDSYVLLKDGEAWLMGAHITPLTSASTHVIADPTRTRKLLLNKRELAVRRRAAEGLCSRSAVAVLEEAHDQVRDRPRQGQEGIRQAPHRERTRFRSEIQRAMRTKGKDD